MTSIDVNEPMLLLVPRLSTNKTDNERHSYFTELPLCAKTKGSTLCCYFNDTNIDALQTDLALAALTGNAF